MKLNKHINILLAFLILASNIGLALNVHYCEGKVSSVSFAYRLDEPCNDHHAAPEKSCCAGVTESHDSCCKNDVVKLQDKTDNIIVKSLQLDLAAFCQLNEWKPVYFFQQAPVVVKQTPAFYCEANAPPLFKLYCRYILYA